MMLALIIVPTAAGILSFFIQRSYFSRYLAVAVGLVHIVLTILYGIYPPAPMFNGWLALDSLGFLFLGIVSVLFLASSVYAVGFLKRESSQTHKDFNEGTLFNNASESVFIGCLLLFLATMTFVTLCHHFGLFWVAIESTTLASAPMIYFHRHHRSLEATWKYLIICSVGIAIALLGNFFLAVSTYHTGGHSLSLTVEKLIESASILNISWLKAAFLLFLVGYGTKMGLAPMHTWLPDAHSEAPSVVSMLLSGSLLNCAFLGILRIFQVCLAAGQAEFARTMLLGFGIFSIAVAAVFILGQSEYKRMLAYSSVEHVGILALGIGFGGLGIYGALFHAINHSLTKGMLFLLAGNILHVYKSRTISDIEGLRKVLPISGFLWFAGFLAIVGFPPFGIFMSKFLIIRAGFEMHHYFSSIILIILLVIIFIGMGSNILQMTQGLPPQEISIKDRKENFLAYIPPMILGLIVLLLGLYLPSGINNLIKDAVKLLGGF